ncbi:MAG: Wzz/FepE/Etk N-terminal domain-containing protein [Dongia sp.]
MSTISSLPSTRELMADVFRNMKLIIVALVIPPIIAVAVAFILPKEYQADAKLLIKPGREFQPSTNLGQNQNNAPVTTMAEVVESESEILNSSDLAQDVLTKLGIEGVFPDMKPDANGTPAMDRAIASFGRQLSVEPVALSNVLLVSFRSQQPSVATKVLGVLLADFQARHVTLYSNALSDPIQNQIAEKQKELQDLDGKRIAYQNANNAFSIPEQRASLIQQRAQLQADLQTAQIRGQALQQQVAYLKKSRASTPTTSALDSETDPTSSTAALQNLMALQQKYQEMLQHYQPTAPAVVQLKQQIAQAQQFAESQAGSGTKVRTGANPLLATIDQQLLAAQAELTPITSQIEGYKTQMAAVDDSLKKLQDNELEVNNLQRQIDSLNSDLNALRSSLDQARLAENMDQAKVSSVSIIDAPRVRPRAVYPKKPVFAIGGLGVGVALAALIILVSLSFGNTIITVEGAERILGTPVVAALPRVKPAAAE